MSFLTSRPQGGGYSDSPEFDTSVNELSNELFTLTSNISTLHRLLAVVGTKKDTHEVRERVSRLTDDTRDLCKVLGDRVKHLQTWADVTPSQKFTQQKLSREFTSLLADFQSVQRLSAEKQRQVVVAAKTHAPGTTDLLSPPSDSGFGQQQMLLQEQLQAPQQLQEQQYDVVSQQEIDFQNSLIAEREIEIQGIEQGISELNEIFRDLGTMVTEQGVLIDNIESNITNVAVNTQNASTELTKASRYQKSTRNKCCCLFIILAIILTVVLLAVFLG
ncbi:t-SNARE [Dipodascopsis tothii]|uniref:t-SNARE n=1 Tax=Dipodascopsis tothii TaxID=44089 RepID=UPI0034CF8B5A